MRGVWWTILIASVACGRHEAPRTDSVAVQSPPSAPVPRRVDSAAVPGGAPATKAPATTPACVSEGDWQQCSIAKRLTDAGYVPIAKGPAPSGIFPVPGTTYALGNAELHVYVFKSAKERQTAVAAIDTVAVARRGAAASWPLQPTLITSNNVAAVLVSDNGRMIERVQNAIIAGLPRASTP